MSIPRYTHISFTSSGDGGGPVSRLELVAASRFSAHQPLYDSSVCGASSPSFSLPPWSPSAFPFEADVGCKYFSACSTGPSTPSGESGSSLLRSKPLKRVQKRVLPLRHA